MVQLVQRPLRFILKVEAIQISPQQIIQVAIHQFGRPLAQLNHQLQRLRVRLEPIVRFRGMPRRLHQPNCLLPPPQTNNPSKLKLPHAALLLLCPQ